MNRNETGSKKPKAFRKKTKPKASRKTKPLEIGRLLRELMGEAVETVEGGRVIARSRTEFLIHCCVVSALNGNVQAAHNILKWLKGDTRDLELDDRPISMTEREFAIAKVSRRIPRGASVRKNGKRLPDSAVEKVFRFHKGMTAREAAELYSAEIANSDPE